MYTAILPALLAVLVILGCVGLIGVLMLLAGGYQYYQRQRDELDKHVVEAPRAATVPPSQKAEMLVTASGTNKRGTFNLRAATTPLDGIRLGEDQPVSQVTEPMERPGRIPNDGYGHLQLPEDEDTEDSDPDPAGAEKPAEGEFLPSVPVVTTGPSAAALRRRTE